MAGPASLAGNLPDGPANGLAVIAGELVEHPTRVHVVVALIDTCKVTTRVDSGNQVATVRVRRLEVITDPADAAQLRHLLEREFERRTGQCVLPFDLEQDVRAAFETTGGIADDDDEMP